MSSDIIRIFDTTLRDGEQAPGCSMNLSEKLLLARQLERLGVDVIEAGFPIASEGDFESVRAIADELTRTTVCGLARTDSKDIDRAAEALQHAKKPRIHTFIATSDIHLEHKLRMSREQVLAEVDRSVRQARGHCDDVEFSAEDATRSDIDFLVQVFTTAIEAGASTCNVPDTVGYTVPEEFAALVTMLFNRVPNIDKAVISVHCHNDLGLAVANSLAAVEVGARQVECTINGLGERAGNAAMEEVVMALRTRRDVLPYTTAIKTEHIIKASRLVSAITGFAVQPNKAIVGANAFAHEAGIHQDGMLKHAGTYEIMTPESVGLAKSTLVMGKHSGRHAFRRKLEELGYELGDNALRDVFHRFKQLADLKVQFTDRDLVAIVDEQSSAEDLVELLAVHVSGGTTVTPRAKVRVQTRGMEFEYDTEGDGMVDALFEAAIAAFGVEATLLGYNVRPLTSGSDAIAEIEVTMRINGGVYSGIGVSTDVVEGSARAFMAALNRAAAANVAKEVAAAANE